MNDHRKSLLPYYRGLFYLRLLGGLLMLLAFFATLIPFAVGAWYNVVKDIVSIGVAVLLILMSGRWRLAGSVKVAAAVLTLWPLLLHRWLLPAMGGAANLAVIQLWTVILTRIALLLNMAAVFLEYTAHAALAPEDRKKWYIFLICSLTVSVLSFVSVSVLQPMLSGLSAGFIRAWNIASRTVLLAADVMYLVLLQRAIRALEKE